MDDDSHIPLYFLLAAFFFVIAVVSSYAEFALQNFNESELDKSTSDGESKKQRRLAAISLNDTDYIEAAHLLKTFSVIFAACGADLAILNLLTVKDVILTFPRFLGILAAFSAVMTLITSVFVYLIPRHLALMNTEKAALRMEGYIRAARTLLLPFVYINYYFAKFILALFRVKISRSPEKVTEEDILSMVTEGQETGVIGDEESEIISNVFDLNDKTAAEVMTHRTEICAVSVSDSFDDIVKLACEERYSRLPVYEDSVDNIIGIIHIKDLLGQDRDNFRLDAVIREASFIPETQKIDDVFRTLKSSSTHLAVVVDEYGGTAGIITMEDILEELVGNIRDEYDQEEAIIEEKEITHLGGNSYLVAGLTQISTINETLGVEIPDDQFETLSGFVIDKLGEIPEENTRPTVEAEGITFTVEASNDKIITLCKLELPEKPTEEKE